MQSQIHWHRTMRERKIIFLVFSFNVFFLGSCQGHDQDVSNAIQLHEREIQVQERAFGGVPFGKIKAHVKSEEFKAGVPGALGSLGGISTAIKIDYKRPAKEVIKDVGDAIIPIINTGLALIPGGALIGGVVSGVWGLISPFFGGTPAENPLDKAITDIKNDIVNLKKRIEQVAKEVTEDLTNKMDLKLKQMINRATNAEMQRNRYICDKYSLFSQDFTENLKNNVTVPCTEQAELSSHIHNCDNFLKDTLESFVFEEYADILWVPQVITSLIRLSFLAEVTNYGFHFGLSEKIRALMWSEMKSDIKRSFTFTGVAVVKRIRSLWFPSILQYVNLTTTEYKICGMQAQFLYFDRQIYPYGVPKYFQLPGRGRALNINDYNVTGNDEAVHIQAYYNDIYRYKWKGSRTNLFNCFSGPDRIVRVHSDSFSFRVKYVPNKSYQIRVLYFTIEKDYREGRRTTYGFKVGTGEYDIKVMNGGTSDRKVTVTVGTQNTIQIKIQNGKPNEETIERFLTKTVVHLMMLKDDTTIGTVNEEFTALGIAIEGSYVVETVYAFNVLSETEGRIEISGSDRNEFKGNEFLMGAELIVMPPIE